MTTTLTRPVFLPTWEELTPAGQATHIEGCDGACEICDGHRAFGDCSSCGAPTEALGPDELSRCCGSRTLLRGPEDGS